ncbi:ADP-ribose pyrophosphatase [Haladaptatus litoreus]|uniref:ADP-ribose pyrophosphatase n=1 Tax=Haladaptatus litoreus TaxID=553468 RepID=A0A1N6UUG5_9EURY|nr:NUDIX hydrolase [Haladaptatus litoreus]SIQ69247.1 ADP-ribose pyrophosphatase [Haladaptatus litoreus]
MNWKRKARRGLALFGHAVGYDSLERPDGKRVRKLWFDPPDSVAIVARTSDELVLIEEYRPRLGKTMLSCPAGRIDPGESFEQAAERELREETGYEAEHVELLETYYPTAGMRKRRGVVFADALTPGTQHLEPGEFIEVRTVPVADAIETVRAGPICGWSLPPLLVAQEEGLL